MVVATKLNEINSNIFFLLPLIASSIYGDVIYMFLSLSILIASTWFHYLRINYKANSGRVLIAKFIDRAIASLSYAYMFYFIATEVTTYQGYLYGGLIVTLGMYFASKHEYGIKKDLHTYFHVAIGCVSGAIPLAAML